MTTTTKQAREVTALPPIKGIPYPRHHTPWCDVKDHHANWQAIVDEGYDDDAPPCHHDVASGWVPQVNRCTLSDDIPFTRAAQPVWEVAVEQETHMRAAGGGDYAGDSVIVLTRGSGGEVMWSLLPGEARELAAALNRAADVEQFTR